MGVWDRSNEYCTDLVHEHAWAGGTRISKVCRLYYILTTRIHSFVGRLVGVSGKVKISPPTMLKHHRDNVRGIDGDDGEAMADPTLLELDDRVLGVHEELVGLLGSGATLGERLRAALALEHCIGASLMLPVPHALRCTVALASTPTAPGLVLQARSSITPSLSTAGCRERLSPRRTESRDFSAQAEPGASGHCEGMRDSKENPSSSLTSSRLMYFHPF